jgi:transcriptional regulator with XRE-family HTH domain
MRDLRKARDLTLAELGQLTGLSQGYLSQIARWRSFRRVD